MTPVTKPKKEKPPKCPYQIVKSAGKALLNSGDKLPTG